MWGGHIALPAPPQVHQPLSYSNPCSLHFQPLSPLWRMGNGLKIPHFQLWLSLSGDQPLLTNSHLIKTKDIAVTQEVPGALGTLSGTGIKHQTLEQKILLVLLSRRKLKRFRSPVLETWGSDHHVYFLLS